MRQGHVMASWLITKHINRNELNAKTVYYAAEYENEREGSNTLIMQIRKDNYRKYYKRLKRRVTEWIKKKIVNFIKEWSGGFLARSTKREDKC